MTSLKFQFTLEQHEFLAGILQKSKPKIPDGKINQFIDEAGCVVDGWMNGQPSPGDTKKSRAALAKVGKLAQQLHCELLNLPEPVRYLLAYEHGGFRNLDRGFDSRAVNDAADRMANAVLDIQLAAGNCHTPGDGQLKKRHEHRLTDDLAALFARMFNRLPSDNPSGSFGKFMVELSENYLPGDRQFVFGRDMLASAVNRAKPWVELPNGAN